MLLMYVTVCTAIWMAGFIVTQVLCTYVFGKQDRLSTWINVFLWLLNLPEAIFKARRVRRGTYMRSVCVWRDLRFDGYETTEWGRRVTKTRDSGFKAIKAFQAAQVAGHETDYEYRLPVGTIVIDLD
jgi:hypothetical protein